MQETLLNAAVFVWLKLSEPKLCKDCVKIVYKVFPCLNRCHFVQGLAEVGS